MKSLSLKSLSFLGAEVLGGKISSCAKALGSAMIAVSCLASMPGAQAATACQAEILKGRTAHWTYRLIDGRKCWYEGKTQLPKSDLFWSDRKGGTQASEEPREQAVAEPPIAKPTVAKRPPVKPASTNVPSTNALASPAQTEPGESNDPEDGSCCWPQPPSDSFETRWQSLGLRPGN